MTTELADSSPPTLKIVQHAARLTNRAAGVAPLSVDRLLADARARTKLDDYGDATFLKPLSRLVEALEGEARLTPFGREVARTRLHVHLVNRLRIHADRVRRPEIARETIERPLFITGPPRTGTSILFRLLAQDEHALAPMAWQLQSPSPPPPSRCRRTSPRFLRARADELILRLTLPKLRLIRDTRADLPEECCVLQAHAFISIVFAIAFDVPSYERDLLEIDHASSYEWHHAILQQLQFGSGRRGRWVLKSPGHLLSLDSLFDRYPDACVVQTHRDPLEFVPSLASLSRVLRSLSSEPGDPIALAESVSRFWAVALDRAHEFRRRRPELEDRFFDVGYGEIARDPIAVVERIHARFGRDLSPRSRAAMERYSSENPNARFGRHEYSLDQFGLDARREAERFAAYRSQLPVGREER